jgi:hypothetical protein
MKREEEIPQRLVIRNSKISFSDLFYVGIFVFSIYLVFDIGFHITSLIFLATAGFIVWKLIQRLKDDKEQIVIDKNGIALNYDNDKLIKWENIKFAYIKQTVVGAGKSSRIIDWFHIETTSEEFTIKMSDFSFNSAQLTQCVNYFSGREIGHISHKLTQRTSNYFKDKTFADNAYHVFKTSYKRQMNLGIVVLFSLIAVAIYCQVKIDFPYVFAIGWTLTVLIIAIGGVYDSKKLRNNDFFVGLDDKTYEKVINEYGKEFGYSTSNKKNVGYSIFLFLSVLLVFGISYILSKQ